MENAPKIGEIHTSSALRQKAKPIETITPEIRRLIKAMRKTLKATRTGVGLAAPQVGESLALFIVDYPADPKTPPAKVDGKTIAQKDLRGIAVINPQLSLSGEETTESEGCLSLPDTKVCVKRKSHVRMSFLDEDGKSRILEAQGFFARILQHEADHLEGILITDHQTPETPGTK